MKILLLSLITRQFTGDSAHEWLGAGILILWIAHHILNRSNFRRYCTGRPVTSFCILGICADGPTSRSPLEYDSRYGA